jgi:type III restriction enzyme
MTSENPILNNPYREPELHYATNLDGELDYEDVVEGRRLFSGKVQTIPVQQKGQRDLLQANGVTAASHGEHIVNVLRREVKAWRDGGYANATRVTRELLNFWFKNEERDFTQMLFFAQQEAIETAIYLNEFADKSNVGQRILSDLEKAQSVTGNLPRVGFKMATGTGKTVVMGALIVYHFFNRLQNRGDKRFADNFLLIAPGITIRDRLAALRVDSRTGVEAADYYHTRFLVPPTWHKEMQQLNARLVIVNFQALQPRTLQGNKRSPFDGKIGRDGEKVEAKEDISQVIRRILSKFKSDSRLLIINDEAHHCYLPKTDDRTAEGEDAKTENERAAIWFTGLREVTQRFKVRSIYDLSATPYYLTGSGHEPYTLFEWVVSDFGLIEAIESGLVKIPYLPVSDDTQAIEMPVLRNLYQHVKQDLPKAGQRRQRARAREEGEVLKEEPPRIPDIVKAAFKQFYEHYEQEYKNRRHSTAARGSAQLELEDNPPVFIVVCNNTSVSKEVYKYIAGYAQAAAVGDEPSQIVPGVYDLFSNYEPSTLQPRTRPPTLLIDSDALENSGQIDEEFKRVFASEIALFKRDYALLHGQGAAEQITEAEILREVVNTVGKRNALGSHIRCVVSVSMLTEGWDANTVTHIAGLRAFGSQLLCEQVAGRALRRKSYFLQGYDKAGNVTTDKRKIAAYKFPPEYAHIIGVPFKLFKGGKTITLPPVDTRRVFAIRERTERYELTFPNVEGYRVDYPEGDLTYSFAGIEDYEVDGSMLPTKTVMGTGVDGKKVQLSVESILETREQQIIYRIVKDLLRDHFADDQGDPQFQRFHQLTAIVADWYANKVRVLHKDAKWKKLLYFSEPKKLVAHVARAIHPGANPEQRIRPILHYYNPTGSSRFVHGQTTRDTYDTKHSHVNLVVVDSGWEGKAAKVLDDLADEKVVASWVKNAFLDFRIPYTDKEGNQRDYLPDFIVRAVTAGGETINLLLEITGMKRDKVEKKWAVENRWLPAANSIRAQHGWPRWDFLEIAEDIRDARNDILDKLRSAAHAT